MNPANETRLEPQKRADVRLIILLQMTILLFASSMLLTKFAAQHTILSWPWILLYGASVFLLGVYALCWQQFLKRMPLVTVYANRASAMFWSMLFGAVIFREAITWNMLVGVLVIFGGIYLVVTSDV
jgi:drug/metabolite transporter (DMT)-like permease